MTLRSDTLLRLKHNWGPALWAATQPTCTVSTLAGIVLGVVLGSRGAGCSLGYVAAVLEEAGWDPQQVPAAVQDLVVLRIVEADERSSTETSGTEK